MHLIVSDPESEPFLLEELGRHVAGGFPRVLAPCLVAADFELRPESPPLLVFARQFLPEAREQEAASINAWSQRLFDALAQGGAVPGDQPWRLHIVPHYGAGNAGENRCRFIRDAFGELLRRKRRSLLRALEPETKPFTPGTALVQLLLTAPERGWLSAVPAPLPFAFRQVVSPFPKGGVPVAGDKAAPSRAFAKLVEAEQRLGWRITGGETCVDLGASPGSWSYVALQRGASVTAVDRSPLRDDLMRNRRLTFHQGDAFGFVPAAPVDWLLCDVIAAPQRSIDLVLDWVRHRRARRFVVTIKFKGHEEYAVLGQLKRALPPLCDECFLTRLCANKNEVCAFGAVRQ